MQTEFAHAQAQRYLAQRNRFAGLSAILAATSLLGIGAAVRHWQPPDFDGWQVTGG